MHTVYRVETEDGYGPYLTGTGASRYQKNLGNEMAFAHSMSMDRWPCVDIDILNWDDELICGFETLEQLADWFEDFLDKLEEAGYRISVYQCPNILHGATGRQIGFNRSESNFIKVIDWEFFKRSQNEALLFNAFAC